MDPLRSDNTPAEQLSVAERDARIESLLLAGLDHYFATQYDQAINVWTRVLFLDRHHDRARAYIERARSAQAERQRESEALVHQGLEAFHAGDVERARTLLDQALAQGAPRDLALGVLDRIARLGTGPLPERAAPPVASWTTRDEKWEPSTDPAPVGRRSRMAGATVLLIVAAFGAAAVGLWGLTLPDLRSLRWPGGQPSGARPLFTVVDAEPLPLAAASEAFVSRARTLKASGRLRDALNELDRVAIGDPLRGDADRLRADIQRELLAVASAPTTPPETTRTPTPSPPGQ